jgi:taurine dioxygenase
LEVHPVVYLRAEESPFLMKVGHEVSNPYVYGNTEIVLGRVAWHRDTAFTANVAKGAVLRIIETPPIGGETLFCDTARAYDDLPFPLKKRLEGLEYRASLKKTPMEQNSWGAIWDSVRALTEEEAKRSGVTTSSKASFRPVPELPPVIHPAVLAHPESGRHCLFLSPKEFDYFLDMSRSDSDELYAELMHHLLLDDYVYEHSWQVDDAVAWDNGRFMHAATGSRVGDRRRGLRTTLAGEWTIGRWYNEELYQ